MVLSLPHIILQLMLKGFIPWCAAHFLARLLLAIDSVQDFTRYFQPFGNFLQHFHAMMLVQVAPNPIFSKSKMVSVQKKKKKIQRPNTEALAIDYRHLRPP
jgi:hypothetical protein